MTSLAPRVLVFDLGKVFIDFDISRAVEQVATTAALPASSVKKFIFDDGLENEFEAGAFDFLSLHRQFEDHFKIKVDCEALALAAADMFTVMPESLLFLQDLRKKYKSKIPFVLLSNTNEIHWDFIEKHWQISQWFDHVILSFKVKAMKPNPKIYQEVTRITGQAPERCFFVDDILANVEGARSEGFDAVLFAGVESLRQELLRRDIFI